MSRARPPLTDARWEDVAAETTPLGQAKPNAPKLPKHPAPTGTPLISSPPRSSFLTPKHYRATPLIITSNTAQCLSGHAPQVNRATLKALANGQILPQEVLDLHGLHEGDAWLHLYAFLHQAAHTEHKGHPLDCVLIIHGKGRGHAMNGGILAPAEAGVGILKSQMAAMLARHPAVLAFHTALPQHGGQGATYVLLHT
jgi:DNA-nicking Smr family endonuclease